MDGIRPGPKNLNVASWNDHLRIQKPENGYIIAAYFETGLGPALTSSSKCAFLAA